MSVCCEAFAKETGTRNEKIEQDKDGTWYVNGCCGGGCYVLSNLKFCPFCGAALPTIKETK